MSHKLGNHRVRPALSNATRAKASINTLRAKLADAKRVGTPSMVKRIEEELNWAIINSLVP